MKLATTEANLSQAKRGVAAFSLKELLVVLVVLVVLAGSVFPALSTAKRKSWRMTCASRLKNIGLSFRVFATDHSGQYPMQCSTNAGGTLEFVESGEVHPHFQVLSNELSTPKILICPADGARGRSYATPVDVGFADENLSYFVGVNAKESLPNSILSGDRNVEGGHLVSNRIFQFTSSNSVRWGTNLHVNCGNLLLGDGSYQQVSNSNLYRFFRLSGNPTNRLAIPK